MPLKEYFLRKTVQSIMKVTTVKKHGAKYILAVFRKWMLWVKMFC